MTNLLQPVSIHFLLSFSQGLLPGLNDLSISATLEALSVALGELMENFEYFSASHKLSSLPGALSPLLARVSSKFRSFSQTASSSTEAFLFAKFRLRR